MSCDSYHVVQWRERYENSETLKLETLSYYVMPAYVRPNYFGNLSRLRIAREKDACALHGSWAAILDVASASSPKSLHGWLVQNGKALIAEDLEVLTRFPADGFKRALRLFAQYGWLEQAEIPAEACNTDTQQTNEQKGPK